MGKRIQLDTVYRAKRGVSPKSTPHAAPPPTPSFTETEMRDSMVADGMISPEDAAAWKRVSEKMDRLRGQKAAQMRRWRAKQKAGDCAGD